MSKSLEGMTAVSLFAGIGGFDLALERAGVHVAASVEIDPACQGVLRRQFPESKIFNDVREVTGDQLRTAGFVPGRGILCGGFPCQDLSVAGRRAGLVGARSGLFWEIMRLADELSPRWLLLENVPGLLSAVCSCPGDDTCTGNGRALDCGRAVTAGDGDEAAEEWLPNVPHAVKGGTCPGGCMEAHGGAMGTVLGALGERGYGFAYRVLDAQFFGVPQRRNRVFIAGCLGDRSGPVEVLLEPEGGTGNPAQGRAARARTAGAPGGGAVSTLQGGGRRGHRVDAEGAAGGHLIAFDAAQITHPENRANPQPGDPNPPLAATGQPMIAGTLRSHPRPTSTAPGSVTISHALTAREGKGADSDATSGLIVAPVAMRGRNGGAQAECGEPGDPAFTLRTPGGGSSYPMIAHALTSEGADASEDGTGRGTPLVAVPVAWRGRGMEAGETGIANAIRSGGGGHTGDQMGYVMSLAVAGDFSAGENVAQTVRAAHGHPGNIAESAVVRRLTPMECERLQGFPDDWTRWADDGTEQSDSARYRQCGNAIAVPVAEWILQRLVAVDQCRSDPALERRTSVA